MTQLRLFSPFDFSSAADWEWDVTGATATSITLTSGIYRQTFSGSFTYSSDGTVSGLTSATNYYQNGVLVYSITGLAADAGRLQQFAETAGDTQATYAYVLGGSDSITGSSGNDVLLGYAGNDTIAGGGGSDAIDGGDGDDTVVISAARANASVTYSAAQGTYTISTATGTATVGHVEHFVFSDQSVDAANLIPAAADDYAASLATTGTVAANGSATGTLETAGDDDWFRVNLVAGTSYVFTLGSGAGSGLDPLLQLRNAQGALVTSNDDGPFSLDSRIEYTATATGTYYLSASSSYYGSGVGGYTLAVQASSVPADTAPPTLVTANPADGATQVAATSDIVLTFSEAIKPGTGSIVLMTQAGVVVETFNVSNLALSGSTLTINPTAPLAASGSFKVLIPAGAITDLAGNAYAGTASYDFTVAAASSGGSTPGQFEAVSANASGVMADRASKTGASDGGSPPAISADGRFVVFLSWGGNLVPGDEPAGTGVIYGDAFVKDMTNKEVQFVVTDDAGHRVERMSGDSTMLAPVHDTTLPAGVYATGSQFTMSADGRYVAFTTMANNLVPYKWDARDPSIPYDPTGRAYVWAGDINKGYDIYVKDLVTGAIVLGSSDANGLTDKYGYGNWDPALSANGRYLAFSSAQTGLVSGDTNNEADIFIKDLQTEAIERVAGTAGGGGVKFSADGHYIVYESWNSHLVAGDTNNGEDIFRKDLQTGEILRVNTSSTGAQSGGTAAAGLAAVSADGRYIAFQSWDTDLVAGDTNNGYDVYYKDMQTGKIQMVSMNAAGQAGDQWSLTPSISGDGRYVVFSGGSSNLVPGDAVGHTFWRVFIKDMQTGETRLVSDFPGTGDYASLNGTISADGRFVVFQSHYDPGNPSSSSGGYNADGTVDGGYDWQVWRVGNPFLAPKPVNGSAGTDTLNGSDGADVFAAGDGNDVLNGKGGDDILDGGAGLDTALFSGAHTTYTVSHTSSGFTVSGPEGNDTLTGVERLQFSDVHVALDVEGNAGMAYRLYQAAFNRTPDIGGLGYQMHDLDIGVPLWQVASNFIASPEFQHTYGALSNSDFVRQLYLNVLHREADAGGWQYHIDRLTTGVARYDVLIGFSESPENKAALIGAIEDGMVYSV